MVEIKRNMLLVLASACHIDASTQKAFVQAQASGAKLSILYVVDPKAADNITNSLTNTAFIGEKPSDDLRDALLKEYRLRAESRLEELAGEARDRGIPVATYIREGEIETQTLELVKKLNIDLLVVPRCKRTPLSELVMGSACDRLKINAPCEVLLVDEN